MPKEGCIVLVVDDSPIIVERLVGILRDMASVHSVHTCGNYAESIQLLNRTTPDVALLDIHLPDKSGWELLGFIKEYHPVTKVIMISNQNSTHYRLICRDRGADDFMDKSNDFEQLPDIIWGLED